MQPAQSQVPQPMAAAKQVDYQKVPLTHPNYRLGIVQPLSGGGTVTISPNGTTETIFELGTNVFNLARSFICGDYNIPPTAAAYTVLNTNGFIFASTVNLQTRTGIMLCELPYANLVTNIFATKETDIQELLQNDDTQLVYASQVLGANNLRPQGVGFVSPINYTEPNYVEISGLNTAMGNYFKVPFSIFKNTILALDKGLLFGEVLNLRIMWGPGTNIAYTSTSNVDISTGAAAIAGNITINNLKLFIAYEQDSQIIAGLRANLNEGFTFPIDYVYTFRTPANTATTSSALSRLNRGYGIVLRKYILTAFNGAAGANLVYDRSNIPIAPTSNGTVITIGAGSQKVQQFVTSINNARIEDINLNTSSYDDWMYMMPILKRTVNQGKEVFYYNWFYSLHFDGQPNCVLNEYFESPGLNNISSPSNLVAGIALNNSECLVTHTSTVTANLPYVYYQIFCTKKILTCSPTTTSCL